MTTVAPTAPTSPVHAGTRANLTRWTAPALVAGFAVVSLIRTGVDVEDTLRFAAYWVIAVVVPGVFVSRLLISARPNLVEDLSIGSVTGISLQVTAWMAGVGVGIGELSRFWWIPVIVGGIAIPAWRRRVLTRVAEPIPLRFSAALAALIVAILARLDVTNFRGAPLPPLGGTVYQDNWWQLALVQELMRFEDPQVPQVVGEPLRYHYFANVHVASGARLSGVLPEVVLFRLWLVPIVLVTVGLAFTLGRLLTRSRAAGVVTAWLGYGVHITTYLWPGVPALASPLPNPILFHSPSQTLSNTGILAAAIGIITMLRHGVSRGWILWLIIVLAAAAGEKSTVVPVLLAATLCALGRAAFTRSPSVRPLVGLTVLLLALGAAALRMASGTSGGRVTILGTLSLVPVYRDTVDTHRMLGVNDGLLIDSLTSPRAILFAVAGVLVVLGMNAVRLAGLLTLTRRSGREDLAAWWLGGGIMAGFAATFVIDHSGIGQAFFAAAAGQLGAALTVAALWAAWSASGLSARFVLSRGIGTGCIVTFLIGRVATYMEDGGSYGAIEEVLVPGGILLVVLTVAALWWRRTGVAAAVAIALLLAAVIGAVVPLYIADTARYSVRWLRPVHYADLPNSPDTRTRGELEAILWLRANSDPDDIIATNVHCRPALFEEFCDSRAFWVVGLSGRRAVLEGWGFTDQTQALQGVDGLVYALQPSPFTERFELNQAVFLESDEGALAALVDQFGVRWLVAVRAAGSVPTFSESVATVRFDNGEVTILEVAQPR